MAIDYQEMLHQIMDAMEAALREKPAPGASTEEMWAWKSRISTVVKPLLDRIWDALEAEPGTDRESPIYLEAKRNHEELKTLLLQYLAH